MAPLQAHGGAAAPKGPNQSIRMDSEEVMIRLKERIYTVDAVFHFFNSGDTVTEWVGFPKGDVARSDGQFVGHMDRENPDLVGFHGWVDGKPVDFAKEDKLWLTREVTFPGNATTVIRIIYEAKYYHGQYADYVIGTGSHWKDTIGRASFTVDGSAIGGVNNFSADLAAPGIQRLRTEKAERLEVKDYEPEPTAVLRVIKTEPSRK